MQYAALGLIVVCLLSSAFLFLDAWEKRQGGYTSDGGDVLQDVLEYNGREYELRDNIETMLFLGLDSFDGSDDSLESYNNDKQADFLLLVVMDHAASSYTVLQINRDTMTDMSVLGVAGNPINTVNGQIALAHTYGNGKEVSCRNTAKAVSNLLMHINVDHYLSVTMDAVPVYNDFIGGVEIEVLDDFSSVDETLIQGQTVRLTGEQALTYVRARSGMENPSNMQRMVRQRQYLRALYETSKQAASQDPDFVVNASASIVNYMITDCSSVRLRELMNKMLTYEFCGILELEGSNVAGERFNEFYPTEDSILKNVTALFYSPKD